MPRHLQDARAKPTAHVRAQPNVYPLVDELPYFRAPARQRRVARRAVADLAVPRFDELLLILAEMYRVREDHLGRQQPRGVVHVGVARALGEEPVHEFDFFEVLGDVRLHGYAGFLVQRAETLEAVHCAGGCEAGRDDGRD